MARGIIILDSSRNVLRASGFAKDPTVISWVTSEEFDRLLTVRSLSSFRLNGQPVSMLARQTDEELIVYVTTIEHDALFTFLNTVDFAEEILTYLVSNPFDAMTVVDADGKLRYISPIHAEFLGLAEGEGIGKPVESVIENTRLQHVVQTGRAEIGVLQRMRGVDRVVSRVPILKDDEVVGAVGRVMFKGPREAQALSRRVNDLEREVAFYRKKAELDEAQDLGVKDLLGESSAMRSLSADIRRVARLDVPILIQGESGVGKELVAKALHELSPRSANKLVTVNAAALPESLFESELFGYEKGAFTGASTKGRVGKFEQADGGTLFLDEVGELPLELQAKLLRVLQERVVERLGGDGPLDVDFRFISATNRDLEEMAGSKEFRMDLYYRLSAVVLTAPPLRDRLEDIDSLAPHFLDEFCNRYEIGPLTISSDAIMLLKTRDWPGNIRQLKHEVERAAIFCDTEQIEASAFETAGDRDLTVPQEDDLVPDQDSGMGTLQDILSRVEDAEIRKAMNEHKGNKKRVADSLGISRSYLYKKLSSMGAS